MSIDDVVAASNTQLAMNRATSATDSEAATPKSKTTTDKDTFLKLLVAQLKYQDPSKPVDSTAFLSQTAQFSALEAMQDVSANSASTLGAQLRLNASQLVGQTVSYTDSSGAVVTGKATAAAFNASSIGGTGNEPVIRVDGKDVLLSAITGVGAPAASTPTPAAGGPTASSPTTTSPTASSPTATSPTATSPTATSPTATSPTATTPTATTPAAGAPAAAAPAPSTSEAKNPSAGTPA